MKKILFAVILGIAVTAYAETDVNAVRGSTGFVELGNSYGKMLDVLGRPDSSFEHVIHDRKGWPHKAMSYRYSLNNVTYTLTLVDGNIYRIVWER